MVRIIKIDNEVKRLLYLFFAETPKLHSIYTSRIYYQIVMIEKLINYSKEKGVLP